MTRTADAPEDPAAPDPMRADVCIIGAGIVGLFNALQYAKRGLSVVLIDHLTERGMASYKVGESLLVYANAFLRTIGELDDELTRSRGKLGFWMAYGMERRTTFGDDINEWGFQARLPQRWLDAIPDRMFARTMFGDVQIVRPDIEAAMRATVRRHHQITFIDTGHVRDVQLGDGAADHLICWTNPAGGDQGTVRARWVIDCSGRARFLAKKFGHDVPLTDGFASTAVWAQFKNCTDQMFDQRWEFRFPDGERIRRDQDTVHLWGDGYWIWLIRLADDRISVGVSYDRSRVPPGTKMKEFFWEIIRRYPLLDFLQEPDVLEFRAYRDVQHITDTFVSERRYAMSGDASSIIDAYYSQGISLSLCMSWHVANIAERDIRDGNLDVDYLRHANRAAVADWRIMRSMIKHKYGPAIRDGRFFVLDHLLDYMVFGAALLGRYRISRWLAETGGDTSRETPTQLALRQGLQRRLFLSQSTPWHRQDPQRVASIIERGHAGLARRATGRVTNGDPHPPMKAALRAHAAIPGIWRLPTIRRRTRRDLTLRAIKEPAFMRLKGTETRPLALAGSGPMLVLLCTTSIGFDMLDNAARTLLRRRGRVVAPPGHTDPRAEPTPASAAAPGPEVRQYA